MESLSGRVGVEGEQVDRIQDGKEGRGQPQRCTCAFLTHTTSPLNRIVVHISGLYKRSVCSQMLCFALM